MALREHHRENTVSVVLSSVEVRSGGGNRKYSPLTHKHLNSFLPNFLRCQEHTNRANYDTNLFLDSATGRLLSNFDMSLLRGAFRISTNVC